jgi:hypothetical protein
VGRLILVNDAAAEGAGHGRTAVYARVSSADQKVDLDWQDAGVTAWATAEQTSVDEVMTESVRRSTGIAASSSRCWATGRWVGSWWSIEIGSAGSALNTSTPHSLPRAASWSWSTQPGFIDDRVGDMAEILTSVCARLYGKRAAANRAMRALEAAADAGATRGALRWRGSTFPRARRCRRSGSP